MEEDTSIEVFETGTFPGNEARVQDEGLRYTDSQESPEISLNYHDIEEQLPTEKTINPSFPVGHENEENPPSPKSTRGKNPVVRFGTDELPIQKKVVHIKPGNGLKLGEIPAIDEQISKMLGNDDIMKGLHRLLFGLPGEVSSHSRFLNQKDLSEDAFISVCKSHLFRSLYFSHFRRKR